MTTMTMNARVLVLNKGYQPVGIADVERAFGLFYAGVAHALDANYQTFNFESWSALSAEVGDDVIHTARLALKVPRVLVLQGFEKLPKTRVRFSRQNIYLRDGFVCQYCGTRLPRSKLNLDHVVPKSKGGRTCWGNIVCSCVSCNLQKANRTPVEAGMTLISAPKEPSWVSLAPARGSAPYKEWLPFIDPVAASYWNTSLVDDG